jgi:hypothetical protein
MRNGGFNVIIGNPPWKEYATVRSQYTVRNYVTERTGNLYALCSERSLHLLHPGGYFSFIVQLPVVSASRMSPLRALLSKTSAALYVLPCDDRPGKLFDGLQHCRSTIFIAYKARRAGGTTSLCVTRYNRWPSEARPHLFSTLAYTHTTRLGSFRA